MPKTNVRIVVDTNWWISFVINKFDSQLTQILIDPRFFLVSSDELKSEIFRILDAPKLTKYLRQENVADFMEYFDDAVTEVIVKSKVAVCRDQKDNFLLALSKDSKADFLITGDVDLLVLKKFGKTRIVKMVDFLIEIAEKR